MKKRTAALLGAAVLSAMPVVSLAAATPAVADSCNAEPQKKEFATPGYNTDVSVTVCVVSSIANDGTPIFRAHTIMSWQDGGGTRKFDNFDVGVRLEGYEGRDLKTARCDYTSEINASGGGALVCRTAWGMGGRDFVTGDATVYYDLDRDGEGGKKWQLHGSPHL